MSGERKEQSQWEWQSDLIKFKELFLSKREPILELTLKSVQIPPIQTSLGPRVEHIPIFQNGKLIDIVAEVLNAPKWFIEEIMTFGALYYTPIIPLPSGFEQIQEISYEKEAAIKKMHEAAVKLHGRDPKLQVVRRVQTDILAAPGSYARVHLHPKRFPAVYQVNWKSRVIFENSQFVVVNKPRGVQVPPTVDNCIECTVAQVAKAINFVGQLLNPHRLDRETEGIVLLAKTSEAATTIHSFMIYKDGKKRIQKYYKALTRNPPPIGKLTHYLKVGQRRQGEAAHTLVFDEPKEDAAESQLTIQKVEEVRLQGEAQQFWGETGYESTILLLTGRTHQIRAQLAFVGCPLLGDALYGASQVNGKQVEHDNCERVQDNGIYTLQAHEMIIHHDGYFEGCKDPVQFQAGTPWWRQVF